VQDDIARMEYEFSRRGTCVQAPNRAQNLRLHFTSDGLCVTPRLGADKSWTWSWATRGWGRQGSETALAKLPPSPCANRIEYAYGDLREWYVNAESGVEQGFTIEHRPEGEGPLFIEGVWEGSLQGRWDEECDAIGFYTSQGAEVFRYAELVAMDATGRELPSDLQLLGNRIRLEVNDSAAAYPLTIDPIMTAPAWEFWIVDEGIRLSFAVSTAGDVNGDGYSDVLLGALDYDGVHENEGRAFLFRGLPEGLADCYPWNYAGGAASAKFGAALSPAGDVNGDGYDDVIIGAPCYPNDSGGTGKVFIFTGSGEGLSAEPYWTRESDRPSSYGYSVSWAGDVNADGYDDVLVGQPTYSFETIENGGRVSVYVGSPQGLSLFWGVSYPQDDAHMGFDVAGVGDIDCDGYDDILFSLVWPGMEGRVISYRGGGCRRRGLA